MCFCFINKQDKLYSGRRLKQINKTSFCVDIFHEIIKADIFVGPVYSNSFKGTLKCVKN